LQKLYEAERTIDDYRAADKALDSRLRAAKEEIHRRSKKPRRPLGTRALPSNL
jgi:hypothetical protein